MYDCLALVWVQQFVHVITDLHLQQMCVRYDWSRVFYFLFYFVHNARDLVSPASELRVSKQMNVFIDTEEKVVYLYWIEAEVYNLKSEIRNAVQKLSPIFQHNT